MCSEDRSKIQPDLGGINTGTCTGREKRVGKSPRPWQEPNVNPSWRMSRKHLFHRRPWCGLHCRPCQQHGLLGFTEWSPHGWCKSGGRDPWCRYNCQSGGTSDWSSVEGGGFDCNNRNGSLVRVSPSILMVLWCLTLAPGMDVALGLLAWGTPQ